MRAPKRILLPVLSSVLWACLAAAAGGAAPPVPRRGLVALQWTAGTADLVVPGGYGVLADTRSEIGAQVQVWRFLADDVAVGLAAGIAGSREARTPPAGAGPRGEVRFSHRAWSARLGCDRFARVGERFALFAGPGVTLWRGRARYEDPAPSGGWSMPWSTRVALEARVGAWAGWGGLGFLCQVGQYVGYAVSDEDRGARARWWPTGSDGAAGLAVRF